MRVFVFVASALVALAASTGCTHVTKSCTAELRAYDVHVSRDVPASSSPSPSPSASRALVVSGCVGTRCEQASAGASLDPLLHAAVSANADGTSRVDATFHVDEGQPSSSTPIALHVADASGAHLLDVATTVDWSSDDCHPAPLETTR